MHIMKKAPSVRGYFHSAKYDKEKLSYLHADGI